jgi:hypothetical protein
VSPLWRDKVAIQLSPRRLVLTRTGRGLRPKPSAEENRPYENAEDASWTTAMNVLRERLAQPAWQDANARVVLSDHWVRYAIVPWSNDLHGRDERLTHARFALADIYGESVTSWTVRLSETFPGNLQVACAVPSALFDELQELLASHRLNLVSLQPRLIAAFNRWRHRLPSCGAWFVSIEEGSLAAARLSRSGWDRVHAVRIGPDWTVEMKRLQTFARLAGARAEDGVVFADAPASLRRATEGTQGLQWLEDEETASAAVS